MDGQKRHVAVARGRFLSRFCLKLSHGGGGVRQKTGPDWGEIQAAYVFGGATTTELIKKYHVTAVSLRKRIERGSWKEQREEETAARNCQATSILRATEAIRQHRLLDICDKLADRLEAAVGEMGEYYTVKRKRKSVEIPEAEGDEKPMPVVVEEEYTESVKAKSAIKAADAKALASALRDLREVIRVGKGEDTDGEGVTVTFEGEAEGASG